MSERDVKRKRKNARRRQKEKREFFQLKQIERLDNIMEFEKRPYTEKELHMLAKAVFKEKDILASTSASAIKKELQHLEIEPMLLNRTKEDVEKSTGQKFDLKDENSFIEFIEEQRRAEDIGFKSARMAITFAAAAAGYILNPKGSLDTTPTLPLTLQEVQNKIKSGAIAANKLGQYLLRNPSLLKLAQIEMKKNVVKVTDYVISPDR